MEDRVSWSLERKGPVPVKPLSSWRFLYSSSWFSDEHGVECKGSFFLYDFNSFFLC